MSGSFKRRIAVAAATAGLVTAGWNAVIPDDRGMTPEGRGQQAVEQYRTLEERKRERRRLEADLLEQAVREDKLRSGVHATPDPRKLVRGVLRKVP
jgi:hypothetical protein